jgi:ADP-ribosylglycohydrolase
MSDPLRALWGALIGDACGATLEFCPTEITEEMALHALTMPGGGKLRVGPGQITDDGELSLALWCVLRTSELKDNYPIFNVARAYAAWYNSMPFDIGRTCSLAFECLDDHIDGGYEVWWLRDATQKITRLSHHTESNGGMMRISPIAVWHAIHANHFRDTDQTAFFASMAAQSDARLSHPGEVTVDANSVYVYALTHLLLGTSPSETIKYIEVISKKRCQTVKKWVDESKLDVLPNFKENAGHVRYAFVASLWFLRRPDIGFEESLKIVLMNGGDTDTNAAIVGAMVACYQPIPSIMRERLLSFDCVNPVKGIQRPKEYGVKYQLV